MVVFKYNDNAFKDSMQKSGMDVYSQLLERMANASGVSLDELERRVEAKRAKLSGLISKEGAAQIDAAELGIIFDNVRVCIADLLDGLKRAHVAGVITKLFPVRSYSKNGREGKIGSLLLGDASSNVRIVLWDSHHIELIENGYFKEGDSVELFNASVRNSEVHLGSFSDIKKTNEVFDDVKTVRVSRQSLLRDAKAGLYAKVRATIVQLFEPRIFDDKRNPGTKRLLANAIIDDGSDTMRVVLGVEQFIQLGFKNEDLFLPDFFARSKEVILGEDLFFTGTYRVNTYFNHLEMSVERIDVLNKDELMHELEAALVAYK